ncbi:MAG: phosphatase PAP2 family protein [Bacteroidetes bacterium]|nr:MAG: phosphatase PAP2 family protein [Bacteroidota bacterium]
MEIKFNKFTNKIVLTVIWLMLFQYISANCESPYKLDWTQDGIILGTGIGTGAISLILDGNVKPLTIDEFNNLNRNDINGFDRFATDKYSENISKLSDYVLGTAIVSPLLFVFSENMGEDWFTIGVMYSETIMFSGFLSYLAKGTTQRIRPYAYNDEVPTVWKLNADVKKSFFSGHTSIAFSSAVFLSVVYSDYYPDSDYKPYIWGASLLLASGIGIMRIESGMHFPTDVIVGALVGSASGYLIPYLHRIGNKDDGVSFNYGIDRVVVSYKF